MDRLGGDEDLDAVLLEMGTKRSDKLPSTEESSLPIDTVRDHDSRFTQDPAKWPGGYHLEKSFDENCQMWEGQGDKCTQCRHPKTKHQLRSESRAILPRLFACTRNLRCLYLHSEKIDICNKFLDHLKTLSQHKKTKKIPPENMESILEKIQDLESQAKRYQTKPVDKRKQSLRSTDMVDRVYYRVYYAALVDGYGDSVPHPPTYFTCTGMARETHSDEHNVQEFLARLSTKVKDMITRDCGLLIIETNPLHRLWQSRFREQLEIVWKSGYAKETTKKALDTATERQENMQQEFAKHETLADRVIADWRDTVRDFPASLYSYATPSPKAIEIILNAVEGKSLVEIGAGTGYWASLLKEAGVDVKAMDISPTGSAYNEYHGNVPAFTSVESMDSSFAESRALFLCYPTPGTDMAFSVTRTFFEAGGPKILIHVGEWSGLTGDARFEDYLRRNATCVESLLLPSWGTDAAYLTVWKHSANDSLTELLGAGGCIACCQRLAVKRCRFQRILQYCGKTCYDEHKQERRSFLTLQMIILSDDEDLNYSDSRHFQEISAVASTSDRKRPRKKRREKK